jgi:hypothetical protein
MIRNQDKKLLPCVLLLRIEGQHTFARCKPEFAAYISQSIWDRSSVFCISPKRFSFKRKLPCRLFWQPQPLFKQRMDDWREIKFAICKHYHHQQLALSRANSIFAYKGEGLLEKAM